MAVTTVTRHRRAIQSITTLRQTSIAKVQKATATRKLTTGGARDMSAQLHRIATCKRTDFEKKVWTLLCQIPEGRVSTYGLMASYLGSSPRAVGGALRRNPFAPEVPCHRVVETGGRLGGFKGAPSRNGEGDTIGEKVLLLQREGVRLDLKRYRVLEKPWRGFSL
ncbi:RING-2 [Xylaria sp. CBS 124048]|nr:RING-2 [Xylaria sp. CBS 124048]